MVIHSTPIPTRTLSPLCMRASAASSPVQVAGASDPLLLGGITEALIFHLKQTISDLCFESA